MQGFENATAPAASPQVGIDRVMFDVEIVVEIPISDKSYQCFTIQIYVEVEPVGFERGDLVVQGTLLAQGKTVLV